MTHKRLAPVDQQTSIAQVLADVTVHFRWTGYSSAEGIQEANV
jgi:hypothetical protein